MATVTWIDLATAAYDAGFRGEAHAIAIALAQPESTRKSDAVNRQQFDADGNWTTGDPNGGSFGLMQINGVHDPDKTGGPHPMFIPTDAWIQRMFIPVENYKVAFGVYTRAGNSFKPWGAFTSNLHLPYLTTAKVAMDARDRIVKLSTANKTLTTQRDAARSELATLSEKLVEIEAELVRIKEDLATVNGSLFTLQQVNGTLRQDLATSESARDVFAGRISKKDSLLDQARAI